MKLSLVKHLNIKLFEHIKTKTLINQKKYTEVLTDTPLSLVKEIACTKWGIIKKPFSNLFQQHSAQKQILNEPAHYITLQIVTLGLGNSLLQY